MSQTVSSHFDTKKLTAMGVLVSLGIVFGDIGTSPLYVMKAIVNARHGTGNLPFDEYIVALANSTADLIGAEYDFSASDLILNSDYVGDGYGVIGALENEAIAMTAQTEGILVDPVYTGRAMGGLIDMIRSGKIKKTDSVLFWHTGGAPALFAYADDLEVTQQK